MQAILRPGKTSLRRLFRSPVYSVVTILTLALGIGATTAIFSVVDAVLLRPLPYPDSEQLASLGFTAPGLGYDDVPFSDGVFLWLKKEQKSLAAVALYQGEQVNLSGPGHPVRVAGERVTPGLFRVLEVEPALGRAFTPEDGRPGAEPVAILSHELWVAQYGADPDVVGRTVRMDGVDRRVIGVAPAGFAFPDPEVRIWRPLVIDPAHLSPGSFSYPGVGRLRPGATPATARADLARLVAHLGDAVPDLTPALLAKAKFAPVVRTLKENVVGEIRRPLWVVLGTVAFVLLIACANVANLVLVRSEGRGRELAVRTALGAGRADLAALSLSEGLGLALAGGALGLGLAASGVRGLLALAPTTIPRAAEIGIHGDVLLFALAVSVVSGLLFGLLPLGRRRTSAPSQALREGGRSATPGRGWSRARNALVAFQVGLAVVLLVGSGLMIRTFQALRTVDPGFRSDGVLTFDVALDSADYPTGRAAAAVWHELEERLGALPGVRSVAVVSYLPLSSRVSGGSIDVEDHPTPEGGIPPLAEQKLVSPAYFSTLGIPLLHGRVLGPHDSSDGAHSVVVNRSFAHHWWPGQSALGRHVRSSDDDPWSEIVGVVGDVRFKSLEEPGGEAVYFPVLHGSPASPSAPRNMAVAVRTDGEPKALATAAQRQVWAIDPHLPIAHVQTLRSVVAASTARTSFTLVILGIAAAVSLLLGMVGLYGVLSYVVSQRRREIGVRLALGATGGDVRRMVVFQGLRVVAVGLGAGLLAALALSRLVAALLFSVGASDPMTYGAVSVLLLAVATLACYLPARTASVTDPVVVLRNS
jgi:predicted permease